MTRTPRARARVHDGGIAALRGAIQAPANTSEAIRTATARLLRAMLDENRLTPANVVSALFTSTPDLDADFPAHAARRLGWEDVPLLGATELGVPGAPRRIVRVLVTLRGVRRGARLTPVYLDGAEALRPDLHAAGSASARPDATRVAIVGLGQIGGSIARALARSRDWRVTGFDLDAGARRAARRAGAIERAARSIADACRDAQLAVIAVPVDALPAAIAEAAAALPRGVVLLDTGSARGPVTPALAAAGRRGVRAIGGHPIAGHEGRGFASARTELFEGAPFALLPLGGGVPRLARRFVAALGARPLVVDAARHDRALARTSHLPYVLATALRRIGAPHARRRLAGPGFASATRLAASDPRVASAYCRANARELRAAWRELESEVRRALAEFARGR